VAPVLLALETAKHAPEYRQTAPHAITIISIPQAELALLLARKAHTVIQRPKYVSHAFRLA
jgi:hypothetical protein